MKTSNIIISATALIFVIAFAINAIGLKKMYDRINWNDPYRDYKKFTLKESINKIYAIIPDSINGWSDDDLNVVWGDSAKFMTSDTEKVKWQQTDSGLVIRLTGFVRTVVMLPKLQRLSIYRGQSNISGFDLDSLKLTANSGEINIYKCKINYLHAIALNKASVHVTDSNRIARLNLQLLNKSKFSSATGFSEVKRNFSPDSHIELSGSALDWIKSDK